MNKAGSLFEVIWFVVGGLMLFIGIDKCLDTGIAENWYYIGFSILSFLMYFRRRSIRLSDK